MTEEEAHGNTLTDPSILIMKNDMIRLEQSDTNLFKPKNDHVRMITQRLSNIVHHVLIHTPASMYLSLLKVICRKLSLRGQLND